MSIARSFPISPAGIVKRDTRAGGLDTLDVLRAEIYPVHFGTSVTSYDLISGSTA